jgi:hypothetical protein
VPAGSPIVIHIKGVEGTKDRLVALIKEALPEIAPMIVPKIEEAVTNGIDGRKLAGLPKDGPIFVVFTEVPKPGDNPPKMAVVLAVNKYETFRDSLLKDDEKKNLKSNGSGVERTKIEDRENIFFVDKKGFAVVTPSEEVAEALTKKQTGIDGKISGEQAKKLLAADVGVYVGLDALNKEYAEQIKTGREQAQKMLDQAAESVGKAQRGSVELVKKMIGPVFQALEDSKGLLLTAEFRPNGLALHIQSELRDGSTTSTSLKDFKAAGFKELEKMPSGQVFYSGFDTNPALLASLGGLMLGSVADPDSKEGKAMAAAMEQMAKAGPGVRVDAASIPPSGLQVWHFQDPVKAVAAQTSLIKAMDAGGAIMSGVLKEKPVFKEGAEKYGDFKLNSVELTWDLEKMTSQAGGGAELPEEIKKQMTEAFKLLLGEKLHFWFGTDGKLFVAVTAKDWASAEKLLDQYSKGTKPAAGVSAFKSVRQQMPEEATALALVDAVHYLAMVAEMMKPMVGNFFPLPPNFPAKPAKDSASYVGGAVTLGAPRGSFDLFISAAAVHEAYKAFVQPFLPGA